MEQWLHVHDSFDFQKERAVGSELSSGPLRSMAAGGSRKHQMSEEEERLLKDNQSLALQVDFS